MIEKCDAANHKRTEYRSALLMLFGPRRPRANYAVLVAASQPWLKMTRLAGTTSLCILYYFAVLLFCYFGLW